MKTNDENPNAARLAALRAMPHQQYLGTPEWRRCRDRALVRARWRCTWPDCREDQNLAVHHLSYERLGEERDDDLRVLCARHHSMRHETLENLRRLHWRLIRDVINSGPYESYGDFIEAVKVRFHRELIPYNTYDMNEMLSVSLRDVAIDAPVRAPQFRDTAPHISQAEAVAVLAELGLTGAPMRTMPKALLVRQSQLDRLKALRMVIEEIAATQARCDALEAKDVG
jgi:hypothetical protein